MISINATLIVQIINLLVLIFILNKIMYQPIRKIAAERAAKLAQGQADAKALKQKALEDTRAYQKSLEAGRQKVRDRLAAIRVDTEKEAAGVILEANTRAKERSDSFKAVIMSEMEEAKKDIRAQAERVAKRMATSVLGREVS